MSTEESHLRHILNGFTGGELEFLAEDEPVSIIPSFSQDALPLLGSVHPVGPFRPPLPVQVPLWMAIQLKKQKKASIELPEWMRLERLTEWRDEERARAGFAKPPLMQYVEISRILLHYARDDMERGSGVNGKDLEERLRDIEDLRQGKIREGLNQIHDQTSHIKLNNMGSMELNSIRTFYCTALADFARLRRAAESHSSSLSSSQLSSSQQPGGGGGGAGIVQTQTPAHIAEAAEAARAAQQMGEAQRRNMRMNQKNMEKIANNAAAANNNNNNNAATNRTTPQTNAAASSSSSSSSYAAAAASSSSSSSSSSLPSPPAPTPSQPGADPNETEPARKLRRFQK